MTNSVGTLVPPITSEAADQGDHQVPLGDSQHLAARDGGEIALSESKVEHHVDIMMGI